MPIKLLKGKIKMLLDKGKYLKRRCNGIWYLGIYLNNTTRWHSLKTRNKFEALEYLKTTPEVFSVNKPPLLSIFKDSILKTRLQGVVRDGTLEIYDSAIDLFIKICGDRTLNSYSEFDIDRYKKERLNNSERKNGISYTTLNIELRTLKSMMNKAFTWELISKNPFAHTQLYKIKKQPKEFMSKEDLAKLIEKTEEDVLKDLFTFACYTGMRLAEIINLKFADVNHLQLNIINSDDFETKNGRARSVPITQTVRTILAKRLELKSENNDFVFHKKGRQLFGGYVSHKFKAYIRDAELNENLHFHCTRHTCASWMLMSGVSISTVKEVLGHSSTALIDSTYGHLSEKYKNDEVSKIENF